MPIFTLLLLKLIPLYVSVALGYVAGRWLKVERQSVANIIFYIVVPIMMFAGVLRAQPDASLLLVPLITFAMAIAIGALFLWLARKRWHDYTPNILACAAGTGNTGYFGFPVAVALFDARTVGIYLMMIFGVTIFESSWGFYVAAKGRHTAEEALAKVLRLPTLYAFLLGLIVYYGHFPVPELAWEFIESVKGVYMILGMMIVGLGLAAMPRLAIDWAFLGAAFAARFIVWPALALALIALDTHYLHFYPETIHHALILLSIVPMAANTVVIATMFDTHPEKAATAVLLSTLWALFYVPLMVAFFIQPSGLL